MKLKKILICSMLMATLFGISAQAAEDGRIIQNENEEQMDSILLPYGQVSSRNTAEGLERSSIVSSASSEIIDETGGDIGVIIETLCHIECSEIRNMAILDRLNEETGQWEEQSRYDFIAKKEDFPNTSLTSLTNSFTIENQETGYYYRIRGIHSVTTPEGKGQVYTTRTDGLLITEYGR
ncbi:MAG: hypothetical protein MR562_09985 [Clostridiaceae bacterium]|nr:hypothetical protein [Clostridiaceae bacterium]